MKAILFNLNDIVLVLIIVVSGLLALVCASRGYLTRLSKTLLTTFFVLIAMIALDTLFFWGEGLKYAVFNFSPLLLTCFSFATLAIGPVIYEFTRSEVRGGTAFTRRVYWHLIPTFLTPFYLFWAVYRFPVDIQKDLLLNFAVYNLPELHYSTFVTAKKIAPLIYSLLSLKLLMETKRDRSISGFKVRDLSVLIAIFSFIGLWILLTHICGSWISVGISDIMGILGNYQILALLIISAPIVYKMPMMEAKSDSKTDELEASHKEEMADSFADIQAFMENEKPYLNPHMNLERFAELIKIPSRQVSNAINRCNQQNFQEYINCYRVEEAKRWLATNESSELTILEIAQLSGFNSKATFNRFFKSFTSSTPSAYREQVHVTPVNSSKNT